MLIPCLIHTSKAGTARSSEEDLLLHLSSITPLPSVSVQLEKPQIPSAPHSAQTSPAEPDEELETESPSSLDSQASTASYSLCPKLPITYNERALSCLQGRPQVKICNNLSIPFPSDSECSTTDDTDDTDGNQLTDDEADDTEGSDPAEVKADSSHIQMESLTAGTGMDMPTPQPDVWMTMPRSYRPKARPVIQRTHQKSKSN